MIDAIAAVVFAISALVVVYIYIGYPALIFVLSRLRPRPIARGDSTPFMSLVVPLFNEESVVEQKIHNSLALDYPRDRLEIVFVSDGSTDRTEEIVQHFIGSADRRADRRADLQVRSRRTSTSGGVSADMVAVSGGPSTADVDVRAPNDAPIRLVALQRSGKAAALNAGVALSRGDVVVLTDANVDLAPDALRVMARCFADPEVGGVSGKKKYVVRRGTDTTEQGENLYWRWDQWQKELESAIGSIFAADGTLYAVRRSLYVPIDDPAQADDIAISTRVVLQGYRLVFEPAAVAYEEAPAEGAAEFRRKVRVTNHSVRALLNLGSRLWTSGFYSVELLSHKLVRHLVPFFLVLLLLSNLWLAGARPPFRIALLLQIAFYALAALGAILRHRRPGAVRLLSVPYYFSLVNLAALLGVISIARGRRVRAWAPRGT